MKSVSETFGNLIAAVIRPVVPEIPPAPLVPPFGKYFLLRPAIFAAWFHMRRRWLCLRCRLSLGGSRFRQIRFDDTTGKADILERVLPYNASLLWRISRHRTEKLINILRSVSGVHPPKTDLLCIGPRNEAEVLLFSLYGFSLKRLKAIDLYSYSPLIDLMDMHDLQFENNCFDVVYSSFVIRYSDNVEKALSEMLRVVRPGGLIACGFVFRTEDSASERLVGKGTRGVLEFFGEQVESVLWREDYRYAPDQIIATTIFRTKRGVETAAE